MKSSDTSHEEYDTDVVVVGAGNAGLIAAITAREAGKRVLLLEASPRAERGGNSRFASGVFRTVHRGKEDIKRLVANDDLPWDQIDIGEYPPDRFFEELMRSTGGQVDTELLRLVVDRSTETVEWLHDHGVRWSLSSSKFMNTENLEPGQPIRLPAGGELIVDGNGVALVETLFSRAEESGVEIWYESPVMSLVTKGQSIRGVEVARADSRIRVQASAVILASGSFEASAEARLRYLGAGWDLVKVRGTRFNTGRMLDEAVAAGALTVGHWSGAHAVAIDADSPAFGDLSIGDTNARYSYPFGISVNLLGERFMDEGEDEMNFTYAEVGKKLLNQPKVLGFQIFDAKTIGLLEPRYSTATPFEAETIEELAAKCGIRVDHLVTTVSDFNAACSLGEFDPYRKDGLAANPAGQPPKSNWALPLETSPFRAYKVTCGITFAFAGLGIDSKARVLAVSGEPMAGLYACGEIAGGVIAHNLPGGAGLIKGGALALVAGQTVSESTD